MYIALIPARGGSKRIPNKNIKLMAGKPIIQYAIETAKSSGCFDRIIVSTDSDDVAAVAREAGAEIPFIRPAALADDHTGTLDVLRHALSWLQDEGTSPDAICCIYPTALFTTDEDLTKSLSIFEETGADYVFSVAQFAAPVQRSFFVNADNSIDMLWPDQYDKRSQDLKPVFHDAGQFYWCRNRAIEEDKIIFASHSVAYQLSYSRIQDIDTPDDWMVAELLYKLQQIK